MPPNSGDAAALPALIAALSDEEPLVRGHAGWALGNLGGSEARGALEKALVNERDESVIEEIEAALRTVQRSSKA
jgi:epoxyqueuosine reductase